MTRRHAIVMAIACCVAMCAADSAASQAPVSPSPIVFVSSLATPPGGIDALAPGVAAQDLRPATVAPSLFEPNSLAIAPHGDRIAYWAYVGSKIRLFVAHDDGHATRTLEIPSSGSTYSYDRPVFSSDGSSILVEQSSSLDGRATLALVALGSYHVRRIHAPGCFDPVEWSFNGQLLSCAARQRNVVVVFDMTGRRRFSVEAPKSDDETAAFWSRQGRLAVTTTTTEVVDANGSSLARVGGAALGWASDGRTLIVRRPRTIVSYDVEDGRTKTLLRVPGNATLPVTITPDGRDVVASGYPPTPFRIVPIGAGTAHSLTFASYSKVAWSERGRYAYVRPGSKGVAEVVVGVLSGGHPRVVGRFPYDSHGVAELQWLPDGSRVLYNWSARVPDDLWSMEPDGSDQHRLTSSGEDVSNPRWSPDGQRLAYAASGFDDGLCGYCSPRIVLADASAGRDSRVIVGDAGDNGEGAPSWSPAGNQLVVETDSVNDLGLSIITPGQATVPLTTTGTSPAWSPDGQQIAYLDANGISVIHLSDHVQLTLIPGNVKHPIRSVSWSPDATVIAFTTDQGVYLAAADGSQAAHAIYRRSAYSASFSPDGQQLVFDGAAASNGDTIYTINVDGSALRPIARGGEPAWRPSNTP